MSHACIIPWSHRWSITWGTQQCAERALQNVHPDDSSVDVSHTTQQDAASLASCTAYSYQPLQRRRQQRETASTAKTSERQV
eukprot:587079-Pyramimonas_sp.AAC.1